MADDPTPTPPPSASPTGFFSKPPQRPAVTPSLRPPAPPRPIPPPPPSAAEMQDAAAALGATAAHPWMRYFARVADILISAVGLGVVIGIAVPALAEINSALLGVLVIFVWIFIETVLLATWGTTPGKWLLGITVRTRHGARLDEGAAFRRSFNVWLRGLGLGIPIVSLFTLIMSYKRLKEQGETSWDADGHYVVSHAPMSPARMVILVVFAVLFVVLSVIGAMA